MRGEERAKTARKGKDIAGTHHDLAREMQDLTLFCYSTTSHQCLDVGR